MKILSVCLALVAALWAFHSHAQGAVILTVANTTLFQNTGIQKVNVFGSSTAGESTIFAVADFTIQSSLPTSFGIPAGEFGLAGMIGAGNISTGSSSFNRSTANPRVGLLSIDFLAPQLMPSTPTLLARLNIDTNTFGLGNFNIVVSNFATGALVNTPENGLLTIAVPEPTTMALLSTIGIGIVALRIWKRRKRVLGFSQLELQA